MIDYDNERDASFGTGYNPHSPPSWDAGRLGAVGRYLAQHERSFWRLLQKLEAEEPARDEAALPNEPELPSEPEPAAANDDAPRPNEPEAATDEIAFPNEPKLARPVAPPPCGREVALLRQEVERLVADEDWRTLEQGLASGRYRPLGLEPLTGAP